MQQVNQKPNINIPVDITPSSLPLVLPKSNKKTVNDINHVGNLETRISNLEARVKALEK